MNKLVQTHCEEIRKRLVEKHLTKFNDTEKELLLVSAQYPGMWIEHYYDSVVFGKLFPDYAYVSKDMAEIYMDGQLADGQLPFAAINHDGKLRYKYSQTQECVSFFSLALMAYELNPDPAFLEKLYKSGKAWIKWQETYRMSLGLGLVEMFVGYDTGHDNSARVLDLKYVGNRHEASASLLPEPDDVTPIVAVDLNCIYYGNLKALEKMAQMLHKESEEKALSEKASAFKKRFIEYCYDEEDGFFYDRDKTGNKRKLLSCTVFSLFIERVLDPEEDSAIIETLMSRYIDNEKAFKTPYFYPSMAVCDPSWKKHVPFNCWGYYSEELTALRSTLWMDAYGKSADFTEMCKRHQQAWTDHFDLVKFGQELDPITGIPSESSEWYSSCMLLYLLEAERVQS